MEINKIISNLNILGINNVSETSKKGEVVKTETTTSNVQDVDENSQLNLDKESVTKESTDGKSSKNYKIPEYSKKEDIRNSQGTMYLVVCGPDCARCDLFKRPLQEIANELGDKVDFMELNADNASKKKFYWDLIREADGDDTRTSVGYPTLIKIVDGKAVEVMDYHEIKNQGVNYRKSDEMVAFLNDNIEGQTTETTKTNKTNTVQKTTSKNVKENIYDQEGITYVQFTNTGCSMCKDVAKGFKELAKDDSVNANFVSVNYSEDSKLFFKLLEKAGWTEDTAPLPMVVKYVNGEPVELLSRRDLDTKKINYRKSDSVVKYFKNDIAKTELPEKTTMQEEQTVEETTTKEAELAEDKTTEKNEQAVFKQKLDSLKQNLEVMNEVRKEITTDALENAISNATSISDLKDVISMYSSSLDFELQINLSSVVNEFNSDDDVDSAKEQLLEML